LCFYIAIDFLRLSYYNVVDFAAYMWYYIYIYSVAFNRLSYRRNPQEDTA